MPDTATPEPTRQPLREAIWNPRMLICVFIGFSSGLPLWFLWQLIPYWLRTEGMGLAAIGSLQVLLFPYNWKVVVAPFLDRYNMLGLGRRLLEERPSEGSLIGRFVRPELDAGA